MCPTLYASLMVTHSLLNDSKCIGSALRSNHCPFKDADIPHHSDCYSLAIALNILSPPKLYLFSFGFVRRGKGHLQMTDLIKLRSTLRFLCIVQVKLT